MNAISATSEAGAFGALLKTWADTKGRTVREVLRSEGRKVFGRAIRFTPNQKGKADQERIVERDIRRAIRPITSEMFTSPRLRELAAAKDSRGFNAFLENVRGVGIGLQVDGQKFRLKEVLPFSPVLHKQARNSRGRVSARKLGIGTFDTESLGNYIDKKKRNVGMARAGWAPAMKGLGGVVTAYIRRHNGQGTFEDKSGDPVRAFIRGKNFSPWTADRESAQLVMESAMRSRGKDIAEELTRRLGGGLAIAMKGVTK